MDEDYKKLDDIETTGKEKVIIFHGFSKEELPAIMKAIKDTAGKGADIIMAVSTPTSLEWKLNDLIAELTREHEYFKKK